jgi:hypothetical protein
MKPDGTTPPLKEPELVTCEPYTFEQLEPIRTEICQMVHSLTELANRIAHTNSSKLDVYEAFETLYREAFALSAITKLIAENLFVTHFRGLENSQRNPKND